MGQSMSEKSKPREGTIAVNGNLIKRLRENKGWSREAMVEEIQRLHVLHPELISPIDTVNTLVRIESNSVGYPKNISAIAKALGTSVEDLRVHNPISIFQSLIEDRTKDFVGREFVFDAIEQFKTDKASGYFIIEGPPGIGKSSIMAAYHKRVECPIHFNVRSAGIVNYDQFLQGISQQLNARFSITTGLPPKNARDGSHLLKLLQEASEQLKWNDKLVVAVDALDEANKSSLQQGENILLLPPTLPTGVYFVLTTRPKANLPLYLQTHVHHFNLLDYDKHNLDDIRKYVEISAEKPKLRSWLKTHGIKEKEFIDQLTLLSEGNFMYLHYVLPSIAEGHYEGLSFEKLPRGLERYYEDHWRRMGMTQSPLPMHKIKIIYILSEIEEPVTRSMIADFASEDELTVQGVLDEWGEFLQEDYVDDERCYQVYHASFQDFLRRNDTLQSAGVTLPGIHECLSERMLNSMKELFDDE